MSNKEQTGLLVAVTYENIKLIPDAQLLQKLENIGFLFPCSATVLDKNERKDVEHEFDNETRHLYTSQLVENVCISDALINIDDGIEDLIPDSSSICEEESCEWLIHPALRSHICNRVPERLLDVTDKYLSGEGVTRINALIFQALKRYHAPKTVYTNLQNEKTILAIFIAECVCLFHAHYSLLVR